MYQDIPLRNPNVNPGALGPGIYYIGDLTYLNDEILDIEDYIEAIAPNNDWKNSQSGILKTRKGVTFANFSTWCGDGLYYDNNGNEYCVDGGCIGAYPLSRDQLEELDTVLGNVVVFDRNFTVQYDEESGVIRFDNIFIDTHP